MPGAGAVEIELAQQLTKYADTLPGLEQYAVRKFGIALESFPKALAENSGCNSTKVLTNLHCAHQVCNFSFFHTFTISIYLFTFYIFIGRKEKCRF